MNTTAPAGVAPSPAVTVAVNATLWFRFEGLGVEVKEVVVASELTVCVSAADVLVASVEEPL